MGVPLLTKTLVNLNNFFQSMPARRLEKSWKIFRTKELHNNEVQPVWFSLSISLIEFENAPELANDITP